MTENILKDASTTMIVSVVLTKALFACVVRVHIYTQKENKNADRDVDE